MAASLKHSARAFLVQPKTQGSAPHAGKYTRLKLSDAANHVVILHQHIGIDRIPVHQYGTRLHRSVFIRSGLAKSPAAARTPATPGSMKYFWYHSG